MRPTKILLRFKARQSRMIKAFTNVRHRDCSYPKQLHLGYFNIDEELDAVKGDLLEALIEKWPRKQKPKAIDWQDAEAKLARLKTRAEACEGAAQTEVAREHLARGSGHEAPSLRRLPSGARLSSRSSGAEVARIPPQMEVAESQSSLPLQIESGSRASDQLSKITELVVGHEKDIYRIAYRLCGNEDAAKDLVQETLVRGLKNFDRFIPGTNLRAWLATILTRLFYDNLKHQRVMTQATSQLATIEPLERTESREYGFNEEALWKAVADLEPDLRAAVECVYVRGMRYTRAAEVLHVPVGTIATRLYRARERLRALLDGSKDIEATS